MAEGGAQYYENVNNRMCKDCRTCDYVKRIIEDDPDIEENPINFLFDINQILRLCNYCFHICYHTAGERLFNTTARICLCGQCKFCSFLRDPISRNFPHLEVAPFGDVLQICSTCYHVGCGIMDCENWSTTTSSDRPRLHTKSDDTKADLTNLPNLELDPGTPGTSGPRILLDVPESRTKSTTDTTSDDTQNDIKKIPDTLEVPRVVFTIGGSGSSSMETSPGITPEFEIDNQQPKIAETPGEASNDNQDDCKKDLPSGSVWSGQDNMKIDTPEGSSKNGSVETSDVAASGSQQNITTTDEETSESQASYPYTLLTGESITPDEAASENQPLWTDTRITEENITTDEEASGSKKFRTDEKK